MQMRIHDRYLLSQYLKILFFSVLAFVVIYITVDIFDNFFSRPLERLRDACIDAYCAIALLTLAWWVAFRARRLMDYGYVSDFLHIPLYPVAYFVAVMVGLTGLALTLRVVLAVVAGSSGRRWR